MPHPHLHPLPRIHPILLRRAPAHPRRPTRQPTCDPSTHIPPHPAHFILHSIPSTSTTSLASSLTARPAAAARASACRTTASNVVRRPVVRGSWMSCSCGVGAWGRWRATTRWGGGPDQEERVELEREDMEDGGRSRVGVRGALGAWRGGRKVTAGWNVQVAVVVPRVREVYLREARCVKSISAQMLSTPWQLASALPRDGLRRGGACGAGCGGNGRPLAHRPLPHTPHRWSARPHAPANCQLKAARSSVSGCHADGADTWPADRPGAARARVPGRVGEFWIGLDCGAGLTARRPLVVA